MYDAIHLPYSIHKTQNQLSKSMYRLHFCKYEQKNFPFELLLKIISMKESLYALLCFLKEKTLGRYPYVFILITISICGSMK